MSISESGHLNRLQVRDSRKIRFMRKLSRFIRFPSHSFHLPCVYRNDVSIHLTSVHPINTLKTVVTSIVLKQPCMEYSKNRSSPMSLWPDSRLKPAIPRRQLSVSILIHSMSPPPRGWALTTPSAILIYTLHLNLGLVTFANLRPGRFRKMGQFKSVSLCDWSKPTDS